MLLAFSFIGCVGDEGNKKDPGIYTAIENVNDEELKQFVENYEFDINYPYSIDYLIKMYIEGIDNVDDYLFKILSEEELVVGENSIELEVLFPDGKTETFSFVMNIVEGDIEYDIEDFEFNKETKTIESYKGNKSEVVIPLMFDGVEVLKIGAESFKGKNLEYIYIPESVVEIGDMAFYGCNHLREIRMGLNIEVVGEFAYAKTNLNKIKLNEKIVEDYGNFAFYGATISEVTIEQDADLDLVLKNWNRLGIAASAIPNIKEEKSIYYLESNKTIYGVGNIDSQKLFDTTKNLGLERINDYLFYYDSRLDRKKEVDYNFGPSLKTIGRYAYYNSDISNLALFGLETIEEYAFMNSKINSLVIPETLEVIEDKAFFDSLIFHVVLNGNETRFNDSWEAIGLPDSYKPVEREIVDPEFMLVGEDEDFLTHTLRIGNTIYAVGYTWSEELDFQNDSPSVILPFLFKYDLETKENKLNLLYYEDESTFDSLLYMDDNTFLAIGYKVIVGEVFPHYIKFNEELEVISEGVIDDSDMRIVVHAAINDKNEIAVVSENKKTRWYDIIIFNEDLEELYRYTNSNYTQWYATGIKSQGNDFLIFGSINKTSHREAFIYRLNTEGVVFEHFYNGGNYANIEVLEILENSYLAHIYVEDISYEHFYVYIDFEGKNIDDLVSFDDFEYSYINEMLVVNDKIYIFGRKGMHYSNVVIDCYDLEMNHISQIFFTSSLYVYPNMYEYEGDIYLLVSTYDKYYNNGVDKNKLNIIILKLNF